MPVRSLPERFLVAFSLAGEQRGLVRAIAEAVETQLGNGGRNAGLGREAAPSLPDPGNSAARRHRGTERS